MEYQALLVCPGSSSDLKGIAVQCLHRSQIGVFKRNSVRQIAVLNSTVSLKLHPLGNSPNPVECKDHIRHHEGLTLFTTSGTGGKFRNPTPMRSTSGPATMVATLLLHRCYTQKDIKKESVFNIHIFLRTLRYFEILYHVSSSVKKCVPDIFELSEL